MTIYFVYILVILIFIFVIYTAVQAINRGIEGKNKNKHFSNKQSLSDESDKIIEDRNSKLTNDLLKLNDLYNSGAINEEEFIKAKKKILDN